MGNITVLRQSAAKEQLMTTRERYDAAMSIIKEHNKVLFGDDLAEKPDGYIDPDRFIEAVKRSGGTSEERLKGLSYEDITPLLLFATTHIDQTTKTTIIIKPTALAKDIAKAFRDKPNQDTGRPISARRVETMSNSELIRAYDPYNIGPVSKRLTEISRGEPFIVFTSESGNAVNETVTTSLLSEVAAGYPGRTTYQIKPGDVVRVYKVGERASTQVDENPIYPRRALRPDGTCDKTGRSWQGVPHDVRQFIRVLISTSKIELDIDRANDLIDLAVDPNGRIKLVDRYQDVAIEFKRLSDLGDLPRLKVAIGTPTPSSSGNRMLEQCRKVNFKL